MQHPSVESLLSGYRISPDITIERVRMRPELASVPPPMYQRSDELEDEDDDDDNGVNPLSFCVITMDEGTDEEAEVTPTVSGKSNKKVARTARQSNENSSLVCNGVETQPGGGKVKKRYQCPYCVKTFGWTTDLKRHTLIHTGERPFKCNVCQSTFTRNFLLQKHKLNKHPCSTPNEAQLNNNVAKNLIEIRMQMRALEEARSSTTPPEEVGKVENANLA